MILSERRTSVIIPTHNRARMLEQCLEAVLGQTISPLEIIIVDDGSTDETVQTVTRIASQAKLLVQPNRGKAAALNAALEVVEGEFVWIIDDDDIVLPFALEELTALLDQAPEADFAYGRHDRFSVNADGDRTMHGTGYWCDCSAQMFLQNTMEDFFVHQPGMLVRQSAYVKVGPFDETLVRSQDYEMLVRLARAGTPVRTDNVVFLQRQHDGRRGTDEASFENSQTMSKWVESDQRIFRRIYQEWPLEAFAPSQKLANRIDVRTALICRAVVMGRKKLWKEASADLQSASFLADEPLLYGEKYRLRRCLMGKYGIDELLLGEGAEIFDFRSFAKPIDPQFYAPILRGLIWRIREAVTKGQTLVSINLLILVSKIILSWIGAAMTFSSRHRD